MELEDKYDDLETIISTLEYLIDDIEDEEYIAELREIKWKAEDELKELEPLLEAQHEKEERQQISDYWKSVL